MRIAVTGASGNIGTALLRRLAADLPEAELVGVVRRPPPAEPPYDRVHWHALDLADAGAATGLREAFAGADAVVHLAWDFQPSHDQDYLHRAGAGGSRAVIEATEATGVGHLVHLSSLGAYSPGPKDRRVDETWPTEGIATLGYSRDKVAVERMLDALESRSPDVVVARMRPGLVVQRDAASALLRYGVPALVPGQLVKLLPLLPLDRGFTVQVVHSDDVADALVRTLQRRAGGPYNLVSEPEVTRDLLAEVLGARGVHLPMPVLRTAADLAWRVRLQPVEPGWLDLAASVPLLDAGRARRELGWEPAVDARTALAELVDGMAEHRGTASPALRPRSVLEQVGRLVRSGPVSSRRHP